MISVDRIETNVAFSDFNQEAAFEFERDGLGAWVGFKDRVSGWDITVAVAKHDLESMGCSVFFDKATDHVHAGIIARGISEKFKLKDTKWITPIGMELN